MSQRLNYYQLSPELARKFTEFQLAVNKRPVVEELGHLVVLRASQMNGCIFCVDMHVKEGKIHGERELRQHHVAVWWESPLFTDREKAALAWTEVVTQLPPHGVSEEAYENVRKHFSDEEVSDLTFLLAAINGWNRFGVAFRPVPGSADEMYGLTKAGLK
ncbi:MAG TPA: carboxymuconolactone decarboxylase family protein [Bordetella sp.]|jgi:AhpD family alkylhydroperoxidase|nr:carboxymuconolactone decarboxylase family protein [Bordetella sp.]